MVWGWCCGWFKDVVGMVLEMRCVGNVAGMVCGCVCDGLFVCWR